MLIFGGGAFSYKGFLFFPLPFWISWPSQMFRSPETFSAMTQELWSVANVGVHGILLCGTDDSKCISSYRPVALVAFFYRCFFPKMGDVVGKSEGSRSARSVDLFSWWNYGNLTLQNEQGKRFGGNSLSLHSVAPEEVTDNVKTCET